MASSAALMGAGLDSFDSSSRRFEGDDTAGGLTFGSVADSFHSEDYEDEQRDGGGSGGQAGWTASSGAAGGSRAGTQSEDYDADDLTGTSADNSPPLLQQAHRASIARASSSRPGSRANGASSAQSSSRIPSTSTQPTTIASPGSMGPPSARRPVKSALLDLGGGDRSMAAESSVADASRVFRQLGDDSDVSTPNGRGGKGGRGDKSVEKVGQNMTLREQEKVIDSLKKENFDLKLKIHFYSQRLERLQPEHITAALAENVQLKVEFQSLRTELKRYKKLLLEGNKALEQLTRERDLAQRGQSHATGGSKREREERDRLERKVAEQERELARLRSDADKRRGDEWGGEDARAEIARLRSELDAEKDAKEDALAEREDLLQQLRQSQDALDEAEDELVSAREGNAGADKWERKVADLETDNTSLRSQLAAQLTMLATRNAEKTALAEDVEVLKGEVARLGGELDSAASGKNRSLDGVTDKTKEELLAENDEHRDRASAQALIVEGLESQLDDKEREIEELLQDLENRDADHAEAIKQVEAEWQAELEDARARERQAVDVLDEKEQQVEDLADNVERLMRDVADKEQQMAEDADEVEALTEDLKKLGGQIFALEEEAEEKDARLKELEDELDGVDKEVLDKQAVHEQVVAALKEKHNAAKTKLSDLTILHETAESEAKYLRDKVDELAARTAELEEKSRQDLDTRRRLEDDAETIMKALRKEEEERELDQAEWNRQRREEDAKWQRTFESKDKEVRQAQKDYAHFKEMLTVREQDIQSLQDALNGLETSLSRQGESATNDRFALELELDRYKRDLSRANKDLARTKEEAESKAETVRERDMTLATLNAEVKDLAAQLAAQTATRLGLTDKFDASAKSLRDTQDELNAARDRLRVVEEQLSTDHRSLSRTEAQYRDQLTERNTLLLTVYQYMDKMVGSDRNSPRKPGQNDPKPFTNFGVFHDSLLGRLKQVNGIQNSFERRTKEIDAKFADQFVLLKRQQDSRLRQLDKFEQAIKTATETQRQWRQRVNVKQSELEAAKAANSELQTQLSQLSRSTAPGSPTADTNKLTSLTVRATTAERRLAATQGQLNLAEEKLEDARRKVQVAEGKWAARLVELEGRLRAAEEKTKRERQGAKERVAELAQTIKDLEGQIQGARRRDYQLGEVLTETERNKRSSRLAQQ